MLKVNTIADNYVHVYGQLDLQEKTVYRFSHYGDSIMIYLDKNIKYSSPFPCNSLQTSEYVALYGMVEFIIL